MAKKEIKAKPKTLYKTNVNDIVKVYRATNFNKHATARELKTTYRNLLIRLGKDEKLSTMFKEAEEERLDIAESKLMNQINKENITALIFFLKCKGKKRGYIEKQEIEANLNINKEATDFFKNLNDQLNKGKRSQKNV